MPMPSNQPVHENNLFAGSQRVLVGRAFPDAVVPTPTWHRAPKAAVIGRGERGIALLAETR